MKHLDELNSLDEQKPNQEAINGSGLFFFKSKLADAKKLEILTWYKTLNTKEKEFVDTLIREATDEAEFFKDGD